MVVCRLRAQCALSLTLLIACAALPSAGFAQRGQTLGAFTDSAKKTHPWSVTPSHTLIWDNAPYVPVGGTFSPRYLALGATEANWAKDAEALQVLKSKGIADIIIDPVISAVDIPAAAWQKVLDYLDANGFRYGITFGTGITTPLTGTVVKPTNYRIEDVRENQDTSWNTSDTDSAYYVFVDGGDASQVSYEGPIKVRDNSVLVSGKPRLNSGTVAILYPHKTLRASREGALPDVWAGYDRYRDRLLSLFTQVKFGPGLRFFLDPLAHPIGILGEADYLIPDSAAFRLEWEAYLAAHYPTVDDLMNAWGMLNRKIEDFKQASRMIPLSASGRGVPFLLDTGTGVRLETMGGDRLWSDFRQCRNDSLVYYLNVTADVLKREVADVPVVYTRTQALRIFSNPQHGSGFDGLGMAAYGRGSAIVTSGADSVYSQAEESARNIWCLVTETQDTPNPNKAQLGYASKQAMFYDLDWLRGIGAKGFFVNSFQALPEETYKNFQMARSPEQISWLKDYADKITRGVVSDSRPNTLPYPAEAGGIVHAGPIGNGGIWWTPSLAPGRVLIFGSSYAGYILTQPEGEMTVMWSLHGPRTTRLVVADPRAVKVTTAEGIPIIPKMDLKKKTITVMMDQNPMIFRGNDGEILPVEAAEDALLQLRGLVVQAEAAKSLNPEFRYKLDRAQDSFKRGEPRAAFAMAATALDGIIAVMQPYTWLEAERAESHTFSEVTSNAAASGSAYLTLNTDSKPGSSGYGATYRFNVPADDSYTLWISCTPPGPQSSPFVWIVDNAGQHFSTEGSSIGSNYLSNQFAWMNLGRVTMKKGAHMLTLRVTDQAPGLGRYAFAADAFLITRGAFVPNGISQPTLLTPADINATDASNKARAKKEKADKKSK
jgi:hypothetical protein